MNKENDKGLKRYRTWGLPLLGLMALLILASIVATVLLKHWV